jgi:hypothetical protein
MDRPQSLDGMCERLDLAHEEAQKIIADCKRLTSHEVLNRLRLDRRREEAQDQKLIAESQAVTLKSRELLDRLRRDRQREEV